MKTGFCFILAEEKAICLISRGRPKALPTVDQTTMPVNTHSPYGLILAFSRGEKLLIKTL